MTDTAAARADATARIEAHRQRPHTCAACGVSFLARATEVEPITRTLLNGKPGVYALCPPCKANPSEAAAIASLFDLDGDDPLLDGLTVEWFADLAHAMPTRPNSTGWQHIALAPLAETIQARRREVDQRRGGPCAYCGTTLTNEGGQWWRGPGDRLHCDSCWSLLDPLPEKKQTAHSDVVAAGRLCGIPFNRLRTLPHDFPAAVGFRGPKPGESGERPWAHLDLRAMRRRAKEYLTRIGWRWADEYDPESGGVVKW